MLCDDALALRGANHTIDFRFRIAGGFSHGLPGLMDRPQDARQIIQRCGMRNVLIELFGGDVNAFLQNRRTKRDREVKRFKAGVMIGKSDRHPERVQIRLQNAQIVRFRQGRVPVGAVLDDDVLAACRTRGRNRPMNLSDGRAAGVDDQRQPFRCRMAY